MRTLPLLALCVGVAFAASPAAAYKDCLTDPATKRPREDFESLRECQRLAKDAYGRQKDKKGRLPSGAAQERFDEHQRAEARRFFENPNANAAAGGSTLVDTPDAPAEETRATTAPRSSKKDKLGGLSGEDRAKAGEGAGALLGLEGRLKAAAGDGSQGITPGMARDIIETLGKQQGGVSGDMQSLLDSVVRDGGKLKPETMMKLQEAAKQAKGSGLSLGIDPKIEQGLLESDFSQDKVPDAPQSPGSL
jgi:hypothetical protein